MTLTLILSYFLDDVASTMSTDSEVGKEVRFTVKVLIYLDTLFFVYC